jgi:hypothetical protein
MFCCPYVSSLTENRLSYRGHIDDFNLNAFFEPYVRQWLLNTDSKTEQWVEAVSCLFHTSYSILTPPRFQAIRADKFQAEGTEGHSSSVVDLFDSLKSPIDFLLDLEWEDEFQDARFFTALSKVRCFSQLLQHLTN